MQSRPSKRRAAPNYPKLATYRLRHNVAHDMLRVVGWAANAKPEAYNEVFAAYTRPFIALIFSAASIEGYTNYVGQVIDPDWLRFSNGMLEGEKGRPGIRDKIERIYHKLGIKVDFRSGIFQQVVRLFDLRGQLMHPSLDEREFTGKAPPADITELVEMAFSPAKAEKLAKDWKSRILADSKVRDLAWSLSYAEKINPAEPTAVRANAPVCRGSRWCTLRASRGRGSALTFGKVILRRL